MKTKTCPLNSAQVTGNLRKTNIPSRSSSFINTSYFNFLKKGGVWITMNHTINQWWRLPGCATATTECCCVTQRQTHSYRCSSSSGAWQTEARLQVGYSRMADKRVKVSKSDRNYPKTHSTYCDPVPKINCLPCFYCCFDLVETV